MPAMPHSLTDLLDAIERLLVQDEADCAVETCYFMVRFGRDIGQLLLRITPAVEHAHSMFQIDGNQFIAPKMRLGGHYKRVDGTITEQTWTPPPPPDPPIQSNESLPDLGDENFVWRGYGQNTRGVIKFRVGRFLADVNAPSVEDAERLAHRVVGLLRGEPTRTSPMRAWTPHLWALVVPVVLLALAYVVGLLLLGYLPPFLRHWLGANR
jgi:hypothetical protein